MASAREQHLPYCSIADVVVLDGDGSRWVRERTRVTSSRMKRRASPRSECGCSALYMLDASYCPDCGRKLRREGE